MFDDFKPGDPVEVRFIEQGSAPLPSFADMAKMTEEELNSQIDTVDIWNSATVVKMTDDSMTVAFADGNRLTLYNKLSVRIPAWKQALR